MIVITSITLSKHNGYYSLHVRAAETDMPPGTCAIRCTFEDESIVKDMSIQHIKAMTKTGLYCVEYSSCRNDNVTLPGGERIIQSEYDTDNHVLLSPDDIFFYVAFKGEGRIAEKITDISPYIHRILF
jgi:hypothetical protein